MRRAELGLLRAEGIPYAWETALAACLAKEPHERPVSIRALRGQLEQGCEP